VRRQIEFSVDRMGIPWLLVMIAFAVAAIVHLASEKVWRERPLDGVLLALLQYLLVVRAIIGIEGVFNDPAVDWQLIYSDVGTALVALPAIMIAARRRDETNLTALLSVGSARPTSSASSWRCWR
jgi:hypothetical protein